MGEKDDTKVTFASDDHKGGYPESHTLASTGSDDKEAASWKLPTGRDMWTRWLEFEASLRVDDGAFP